MVKAYPNSAAALRRSLKMTRTERLKGLPNGVDSQQQTDERTNPNVMLAHNKCEQIRGLRSMPYQSARSFAG